MRPSEEYIPCFFARSSLLFIEQPGCVTRIPRLNHFVASVCRSLSVESFGKNKYLIESARYPLQLHWRHEYPQVRMWQR